MGIDHLAEGQALSASVGWPHRIEDWAFLLKLGRGSVMLEDDRVVGTIIWWPFGKDCAGLGMVIVAQDRQGRGIGRKLVETAIAEIGPRAVFLTATQEGLPLYAKVGFERVGTLIQHQGLSSPADSTELPGGASTRALRGDDLETVAAYDARSTGLTRKPMLGALLEVGEGLVIERDGQMTGYALSRRSGRGHVIGPIVASDKEAARALIRSWIQRRRDGFLRIDLLSSSGLSDWLTGLGLAKVAEATQMWRGTPPATGSDGPRVFAVTSQALG